MTLFCYWDEHGHHAGKLCSLKAVDGEQDGDEE